jgi:GNAT superfamily N-acetyltransferase
MALRSVNWWWFDNKPRTMVVQMLIDTNAGLDDAAVVLRGLREFNEVRLGPADEQPVRIVVREGDGRIVGGLLGHTRWSWLYVGTLWVEDSVRGQGWGTKLMNAAEELARSRGCTHVSLDTFEYQARPFYEKLGYKLFGTLEDYPPGYRQFYLTKKL